MSGHADEARQAFVARFDCSFNCAAFAECGLPIFFIAQTPSLNETTNNNCNSTYRPLAMSDVETKLALDNDRTDVENGTRMGTGKRGALSSPSTNNTN